MNFDKIIREMEALQNRMTEAMFRDFGSMEEKIISGEVKGNWQVYPIDKPGVKGFVARGFFTNLHPLEKPTEILPPLKPMPRTLREPLYDISVEKDQLVIFIELPGVEEDEIQLDTEPERLKVKAKDFQTEINLSSWMIDTAGMDTEYRNGVLKVVVPKKKHDK